MAQDARPPRPDRGPDAIEPPGADLEAAARAFVPDAARVVPVGNGRQVRVEGPSGTWVVRRWPPTATEEQVRFVHELLRTVRSAGIGVVPDVLAAPDGTEALVRDGAVYDAQLWLPGAPIARSAPEGGPAGEHVNLPAALPEAALVELIETVARIHEASAPLARDKGGPAVPLAAVAGAVRDAWERDRARLRPAAPRTPAIQRWILAGERALRAATRDLAAAPPIFRGRRVVCHGDLWPSHVLWDEDGRIGDGSRRLSGIVDWAGAAAGSPLLDLAQLVTHFGGWTERAAEDAIGTYAAVRRLGPDERRLLPAVATLDLIAEAGWLLTAAYGDEDRKEPVSAALRDGIDDLVASLEGAAAVAVRGDRPTRPVRRAWVRRTPGGPGGRRDGGGPSRRRPTSPDRETGRRQERRDRAAERARPPRPPRSGSDQG